MRSTSLCIRMRSEMRVDRTIGKGVLRTAETSAVTRSRPPFERTQMRTEMIVRVRRPPPARPAKGRKGPREPRNHGG